jgi:hypothetical protein
MILTEISLLRQQEIRPQTFFRDGYTILAFDRKLPTSHKWTIEEKHKVYLCMCTSRHFLHCSLDVAVFSLLLKIPNGVLCVGFNHINFW